MNGKPHIEERITKVTARIDNDLYRRVKKHFHHGQLQALFSQIFHTMDRMIERGQIMEIVTYIQGKDSVIFKPNKEK